MQVQFIEHGSQNRPPTPNRRYGFFHFMGDLIMVALTSGLWLIWIFVREMRRR
jgi:hypothetical protein